MGVGNPIRYLENGLQPQVSPEKARRIHMQLPASVTYVAGQVMVETATAGSASAYAGGGAASLGVGGSTLGSSSFAPFNYSILEYACTTDSTGTITNTDQWGGTENSAPCFIAGIFNCGDLTDLDSQVIQAMNGKIITGNTTVGLVSIGQ